MSSPLKCGTHLYLHRGAILLDHRVGTVVMTALSFVFTTRRS